jgi:hypothetical protein
VQTAELDDDFGLPKISVKSKSFADPTGVGQKHDGHFDGSQPPDYLRDSNCISDSLPLQRHSAIDSEI